LGFLNFIVKSDLWTGRVAQVVDSLLSKCEALSSNPSTTKKRKRERFIRKAELYLKG
jgi:hypothetical protein